MKTILKLILQSSLSVLLGKGTMLAQAPEIDWQKSLGGSESEFHPKIQPTRTLVVIKIVIE